MRLMNAAVRQDRDCSNMCLYMFHMTSTIIYWHAKNEWTPEIAFRSVKKWNEGEYGTTVSRANEFMDIFGDSLFRSVSVSPYPLFAADNWSVRHDLRVRRTLRFHKETTTYEFFTQHPPIRDTGLGETVLANVALNITFMSVHPTFHWLGHRRDSGGLGWRNSPS
jgi:hypothetical protein